MTTRAPPTDHPSHHHLELPLELVRKIYADAGDGDRCVLTVADRVRGEAVCSTWRMALRDLPLLSLKLAGPARRGAACGKLQWALHTRPEAREVVVVNTPAPWQAGVVSAALHAVQREAVQALSISGGAAEVLPRPGAFPSLRRLAASGHLNLDWWLGLGQLQHLEELQLSEHCWLTSRQQPVLPPLAQLRRARLELHGGANLRLALQDLPALEELHLGGKDGVAVDLSISGAAAGPAHANLRRLQLVGLWRARLPDLSALPALASLWLGVQQLEGGSTITAATALTELRLGGDAAASERVDYGLSQPWAAEVLHCAPGSLRCLRVHGSWGAGFEEALAGMRQLRVLALDAMPTCSSSLGAVGPGPVWEGLKALRWCGEVPLPLAAQQATQLELLQYGQHAASAPTLGDMHAISHLPALQGVCLGVKDPGLLDATKFVARNCLPRLAALKVGVEQAAAREGVWSVEEFLEEAAGLLEA